MIGSLVAQRRQTDLTIYRIDQLEKKVDEHNGVVVRTTRLEGRMTEAEHDIRRPQGKRHLNDAPRQSRHRPSRSDAPVENPLPDKHSSLSESAQTDTTRFPLAPFQAHIQSRT